MKTSKKIIRIFLILFIATNIATAQESKWSTKNGWVMKTNPVSKKDEKFFAIGLWGVPGYTFNRLSVSEENKKYTQNRNQFQNKIKHFNLFYIQSEFGKQYMNSVMKMGGTSEFSWFLQNEYSDSKYGSYVGYYLMRKLEQEKESNSTRLKKTINSAIDYTIREVKDSKDFLWAPFDEIATGYQSWAWPVSVTDMVYDEIKKRTPNKLVFIDLLGSSSLIANSYLFEQNYKEKYGKLPQNPPFNALRHQSGNKSLNDFYVNHEGNQTMVLRNGEWQINRMTTRAFNNNWYENLKKTAQGYKNSGDIFGINSFQHLYKDPALAGLTVDAIKAGIGEDTPVWLFFDSNGYAKLSHDSNASYVKKIKCQMYTSIVHGATGVLFWSDLEKNDAVFRTLLPVIDELRSFEYILYMDTIEKNVDGNIHYMIKQGNNKKYIIAVNASDKNSYFSIRNVKRKLFKPYEVIISELK